jgi:flagellar biosynthetic protein FlhB
MPEQFGDKQHEATPYRRQKAREEGQAPRSQDLASAAMLVTAIGLLLYFGQGLVFFISGYMTRQLGEVIWTTVNRDAVVQEGHGLIWLLGKQLIPLLGLMLLGAIAIQVSQVGFFFLPDKLALDVSRVSPLRGLQRIFSWSNVVRLGFGLLKILIVAVVAYWCLWAERGKILGLCELAMPEIARYVAEIALWTCMKIGAALLILALLDYGYQWWKHEQDLRMTTQELREEMKMLQGDPQIIARRKSVQRQLAMSRIGAAVPKANVVITNPTELAIAIQYNIETMQAPLVVAKGAGSVALRIRRIALEHGIPVLERKELARAIFKLVEVGRPIPPEQYAAMAEVLRYVYELKGDNPALRRRPAA